MNEDIMKELEKFKYKSYVACYDNDSKTITIRKYQKKQETVI